MCIKQCKLTHSLNMLNSKPCTIFVAFSCLQCRTAYGTTRYHLPAEKRKQITCLTYCYEYWMFVTASMQKECKPAKFWHLARFNLKGAFVLVEICRFKAHFTRFANHMYVKNSPQCAETANIDEITLEKWVLYYQWILKYEHKGHGSRL